MSRNVSRRSILKTGAIAVVAAPSFASAMEPNPDAELLAAFDAWVKATRVQEALPLTLTEEDMKPFDDAAYRAGDLVEELPACTLQGVAAKLRFLFAKRGEGMEHYDAILNGTEPNEDALADYRDRMTWNLIVDVERMGGVA